MACIQEGTDNSTFSPDSPSTLHNFGDVLTYTCDIGYNYSTGDLVRTCQAGTGQWTGELPTCLSKKLQKKGNTLAVKYLNVARSMIAFVWTIIRNYKKYVVFFFFYILLYGVYVRLNIRTVFFAVNLFD